MAKILGIESTAHSFGAGMVDESAILSNVRSMYEPTEGGIRPSEAARHHRGVADKILEKAMVAAPDAVAYSASPGIGSCLNVGAEVVGRLATELKIPVIPVNHIIAHLEIGFRTTTAKDPVVVFVSGGNTQIIANHKGWKIFGETLDTALGNAIDKLARKLDMSHPGGPKLEKLALQGQKILEMPYVVKGMDLSYSGIFTHASRLLEGGATPADVAFSFQEHCFAMLVEVAERAVAHTGKPEILLVGGVAQNKRLFEMFKIMCSERGAEMFVVPAEFAGDNGAMIAHSGLLRLKKGWTIKPEQIAYFQRMRVNEEPYTRILAKRGTKLSSTHIFE
ncbi:MAG: tRNA (adenosine(37)-N6)-threonylcarbamoyltransferase complex transferase subunit TsaD [Candidatus Altiarchaeota archaeon]|nr:tRNA (adenosine(37)-N6)-threonylcarbamoyltransferase complex transferase subunit TsaD [Candidatus Altiarchaeota archaeon]